MHFNWRQRCNGVAVRPPVCRWFALMDGSTVPHTGKVLPSFRLNKNPVTIGGLPEGTIGFLNQALGIMSDRSPRLKDQRK